MTTNNNLTKAYNEEGTEVFLPTIIYEGLTKEGRTYETWGIISRGQFCPSVTCHRHHTTQPINPRSSMYDFCEACEHEGYARSIMHEQDIPFYEYLGVYPKDA